MQCLKGSIARGRFECRIKKIFGLEFFLFDLK
jgi:hypothetical protein